MISIGNLQINKLCLGDVEVTKAYLGDVEVYSSTPQPVEKYMTMTVLDGDAGTTIAPNVTGTLSPNLQYRVNNGSWNDYVFGQTGDIQVVAGDVVQWKGVNESGISTSYSNYLKFAISGNLVALSGNIMSLIDGVGDTAMIPCNYCFCKLFLKSNVKTVSSDFLPATTLSSGCYQGMFSNCSNLLQAPELPATTLASDCYKNMLYGCTSLTQSPVLPATTLASGCYYWLFGYCSNLVQAPELPATTLASDCYQSMFYLCTSLTQAPELPATTLASGCYRSMFSGCNLLTQAPVLPATTLAEWCYSQMFDNCRKLNYVKSLATDITASNALNYWLDGVASSGTFVKPAGTSYPTGDSGIPSGWTISNI